MSDRWRSIRKGGTSLHIEYGTTYTNNLLGFATRARANPVAELSVDLNPNLSSRRSTNTTFDAGELLAGGLEDLRMIQFTDESVVEGILSALAGTPDWRLVIELEGTHIFDTRAETGANGAGLFLHVVRRAAPDSAT